MPVIGSLVQSPQSEGELTKSTVFEVPVLAGN